MNATDINDTSLKTRYPKLSSDTDSTFLGGLVLEKSIVDPTYGFENCQNLSTFKMFLGIQVMLQERVPRKETFEEFLFGYFDRLLQKYVCVCAYSTWECSGYFEFFSRILSNCT